MKKEKLLFLLIFCLVFIGACGNNDTAGTEKSDKDKQKDTMQEEYVEGPLTKVGQKKKGEDGQLYELKKIKVVDQTTDLDPLIVTIQDVKIFSITNISNDLLESYQEGIKLKLKDPINYIQISYSAENKGKIDLLWPQISHIILNTKEQVNAKENNIVESGEWDLFAGAKKDITQGIIFESDPKDIKEITFVLNDSIGNGAVVTPKKKVKVTF
ncbi:hypothetical protein [Bacillus pumilus]|uniref:hypothetical protein n=1 Tax=Bacillus pumilus TaxID=1408 RepID=UPI0007EEF3D5|nr:hypothetical protein [Bacillus pumilus]MBU8576042.1 hypothetical protein [Bacillus pumilus]OBS84117.1 hypothetical protein BAY68_13440 [Bacillus pumilus]